MRVVVSPSVAVTGLPTFSPAGSVLSYTTLVRIVMCLVLSSSFRAGGLLPSLFVEPVPTSDQRPVSITVRRAAPVTS